MCDNPKFALSQFDKETPYYRNTQKQSYYFSFCKKSDQSPCDGLLCSTVNGKDFKSLGNKIQINGNNMLTYSGGACDNGNNGHADILMLCGDVGFNVLDDSQSCYLKAEYQHPYFCPLSKTTCKGSWQNIDYSIGPFDIEIAGQKFQFKCVTDFKSASNDNCNDNALCANGKEGLQNPYLREISTNGVAYRFPYKNDQYEMNLKCDNSGERVEDSYSLFTGGPTVKRITWNNGTCPTLVYGGSIVGYIFLAM